MFGKPHVNMGGKTLTLAGYPIGQSARADRPMLDLPTYLQDQPNRVAQPPGRDRDAAQLGTLPQMPLRLVESRQFLTGIATQPRQARLLLARHRNGQTLR
jgi:hypothetical protein